MKLNLKGLNEFLTLLLLFGNYLNKKFIIYDFSHLKR